MVRLSISMRQLFSSLIEREKVVTTEAKAKLLKREVDREISRSKRLDLVTRRRALGLFSGKKLVEKFLGQIVPQFKNRIGGYVRVIKLPYRRGDQAPMARVEFVEKVKESVVSSKSIGKVEKPKKIASGSPKKVSKVKKVTAENVKRKNKRSK